MTGEGLIMAMRRQPACEHLPVLVIAADKRLPASTADTATRLRRKPFDLEHFVEYGTEAAGRSRYRN